MILGFVLAIGLLFGSSALYQKGKIDGTYECEVKHIKKVMSKSVKGLTALQECVLKEAQKK